MTSPVTLPSLINSSLSTILSHKLSTQWAKSQKKKQSEEVHFFNSAHKIQCHGVKNTLLTDCFFGDFARAFILDYPLGGL